MRLYISLSRPLYISFLFDAKKKSSITRGTTHDTAAITALYAGNNVLAVLFLHSLQLQSVIKSTVYLLIVHVLVYSSGFFYM